MNPSAAVMASSTSASGVRASWERLLRTRWIQFVIVFIIVFAIYANQPQIGASPDELVALYAGYHARILIAAIFSSLGILPGFAIELAYPIAHRRNTTKRTDTKVQWTVACHANIVLENSRTPETSGKQ